VVFSGVLNDNMEVLAVKGSYASVIGGAPVAVVLTREVDKRTAAEFEAVQDIERARQMGPVHAIVPAAELRPRLIAAVERGMDRVGRP
jgi:hypothetical protein